MSYVKGSPDHWLDDMTDTVTVYKASSLDSYGKRTVSATGTPYRCRIMADIVKTTTDQKRSVVEEGRLIILNDPDIAVGDKILLPGGNSPIVTRIDAVNYSANGTTTPHHVVVAFGRA
jgi:hypothetical protein